MTRRGRPALLAAAVAALALPLLPLSEPPSTWALLHDSEEAAGSFRASIPLSRTCVLWTLDAEGSRLRTFGRSNRFHDCVRSGGDVEVRGNGHRFDRLVLHAGELLMRGENQTLEEGHQGTEPEADPFAFDLGRYAPGGDRADAALAGEHFHEHPAGATLDLTRIPDGLHYVAGEARVLGSRADARVTVVAEGALTVTGGGGARPFLDGLLLASRSDASQALRLDSRGSVLQGAIVAPAGGVLVEGSEQRIEGRVAAVTIEVRGERNVFIAREPPAFGSA